MPQLELLSDISGMALGKFLGKHDPSQMTREETKELVERYLMTEEQRKRLDTARERAEANAVFVTARKTVREFAAIPEDRLKEVAEKAGAEACTTQGVRLAAAGVMAMGTMTLDPVVVGDWVETLTECINGLKAKG